MAAEEDIVTSPELIAEKKWDKKKAQYILDRAIDSNKANLQLKVKEEKVKEDPVQCESGVIEPGITKAKMDLEMTWVEPSELDMNFEGAPIGYETGWAEPPEHEPLDHETAHETDLATKFKKFGRKKISKPHTE